MPFTVPQIAHSTYRELVEESMSRIPVHTPEWTSPTDSDPGNTLIQLFAAMTESLNYRANLIPERNRAKFLQLLRIPLRAAQPAEGLVTFSNPRGVLQTRTVARESAVKAGRVEFRTQNALSVLPCEGRVYIKSKLPESRRAEVDALYQRLYPDLVVAGTEFDFYETLSMTLPAAGATMPQAIDLVNDTADAAVWLALLARRPEEVTGVRDELAGKVLTVGVAPALDATSLEMEPAGSAEPGADGLVFHMPRLEGENVRYELLEARPSANLLEAPGTVELVLPDAAALTYVEDLDPLEPGVSDLPPSLADTPDADRLITWIRIRAPDTGAADAEGASGSQLSVRLTWVGINAAAILQKSWVPAEKLPEGTGEPNQRAQLLHTPVLPDSLQVAVNGELWAPIDDLGAAGPEVDIQARTGADMAAGTARPTKVYKLDPESGLIEFGNGTAGTRPPRGADVVAAYAYGGGRQGVVGIGAVDKGELPQGVQVVNALPTWGGDEAESVTDAEFRIPQVLRHRDRLVSAQDFADVVWDTPGVDLGRVEVLPLFHPSQPSGVETAGAVTMLLVPAFDAQNPDSPEPDALFLRAVCKHLEPRRLVTTELHLEGPRYLSLWVSIGVEVMSGRAQGPVLDRVTIEVRKFLSPLAGGFRNTGWPLDKNVESGELLAAAARVEGVSRVTSVLLADAEGNTVSAIVMVGLELPRLLGISVTAGEAIAIEDLIGEVQTDPNAALRLPVPVVPEEC